MEFNGDFVTGSEATVLAVDEIVVTGDNVDEIVVTGAKVDELEVSGMAFAIGIVATAIDAFATLAIANAILGISMF